MENPAPVSKFAPMRTDPHPQAQLATESSAAVPVEIYTAIASRKEAARLPQLDGVRGLAILMVVIWHYYVCVPTGGGVWDTRLKAWLCLTWTGVDLFFVLSGFLIGGILLDQKHSSNYFKTFYVRRVCRIFPIYFLLIAAYALIGRHEATKGEIQLFPIWSYVFFLQSIYIVLRSSLGHAWLASTWSLAVEEQFYILFPLVVRRCTVRLLPHLLVIVILVAPLFRTITWSMSHPPGLVSYTLILCRMDQLAMGAIGAWMLRCAPVRIWLEAHISWLYMYACLFGLGFVLLSLRQWNLMTAVMASFGHSWIGFLYLLLILIGVLSKSPTLIAAYSFHPLRVLGLYSYFIYLSHVIVLSEVWRLGFHAEPQIRSWHDALINISAFLVTVLLARASWSFLEHPLIRLGHKWKYGPPETPPIQAPIISEASA